MFTSVSRTAWETDGLSKPTPWQGIQHKGLPEAQLLRPVTWAVVSSAAEVQLLHPHTQLFPVLSTGTLAEGLAGREAALGLGLG